MFRRFTRFVQSACGQLAWQFGESWISSPATVALAVLIWIAAAVATPADEQRDVAARLALFETKVRPLFVKRCYECHGEEQAEGKLRLDTKNGWEGGGGTLGFSTNCRAKRRVGRASARRPH